VIYLAAMSSTSNASGGLLAPLVAFLLVSIVWFLAVVIMRRSRREADAAWRKMVADFTPSDPKVRDLLAAIPKPAGPRTTRSTAVPIIAAIAGGTWWFSGRPVVGAMAFIACLVVLKAVQARQRRKAERFEEEAALAALGVATRALRAGIPLAGVLEVLGREGTGKAGEAFREVLQRERLGEPMQNAIREVLLSSDRPELRAFGLAMIVQSSSGGDLATTTERLVRSLVDRDFVRRRVQSILLYARGATSLLAFFPIIMFLMMGSAIDGYFEFMLDRSEGNIILLTSATLIFFGLLAVQKLGRIEPRRRSVSA